MEWYQSSFGQVELTDERLSHILEFHPEIRSVLKHFGKTLEDPEFIVPSRRDPDVHIFYRTVSPKRKLAIVLKVTAPRFILTAYFVTNIKLHYEIKK